VPELVSDKSLISGRRHHRRVDGVRLGTVCRALRMRKRWRQVDLAAKAGVSAAAVSRFERGRARELPVDVLVRVVEALGGRFDFVVRWNGGELDRLLNARHSALHESVARTFQALDGWVIAPEVSFSIRGERGIIDILAWHPATRALLVIELKTEIVDVNELMGTVDRKRRLAAVVARERGWIARTVSVWVIVGDSKTNRRRAWSHTTTLRAAFPIDGRSIRPWLRRPPGPVACLSFWTYRRSADAKSQVATVKRVRGPSGRAA
jgi:transcriptional regulator with XRE-family HTH domain